jgi:3-oxoacyl-[acyl-carrier-protein] synthase II
MKHRVAITGLGIISPLGNNLEEFWTSMIKGRNGVTRITKFDPSDYASQMAGQVQDFDCSDVLDKKAVKRTDLFVQYGLSATKEGLNVARLDPASVAPDRLGVIMGSGIGGIKTFEDQHSALVSKGPSRVSPFFIPMMIADMAAGQISISMGARGVNYATVSACASGAHAIGEAFRVLQRGECDVMIAGGCEASVTPMALAGFCSMKALSVRNDAPERASRPFDAERDGFVLGEGAGVVILETLDFARSRNAPILAEMLGYGATADAYHITAPHPEGEGAASSMELALRDGSIRPDDIGYINAHGTSTPHNDKLETVAIKRVFGELSRDIPISSTKSMTGHLLGAAAGIEFAATVLAVKDGIIPPTINYENPDPECDLDYVPNEARKREIGTALTNSFGFGGHNVSLVIGRSSN